MRKLIDPESRSFLADIYLASFVAFVVLVVSLGVVRQVLLP